MMIKRLLLSSAIRHALRMMGVRIASDFKDINAIACANLIEGAMGLRKDTLARASTASGIARNFARYVKETSIDPSLLNVQAASGPINRATMSELKSYVDSGRNPGFQGVSAYMFPYGLYDTSMMPGVDEGFMKSNAKPYWYTLGAQFSARILSGSFTQKDFTNLTRRKLLQLVRNFQDSALRRLNDEVAGQSPQDYDNAPNYDATSLIGAYFEALSNPSNRYHNRAKEWWSSEIEAAYKNAPVQYAVLQAFRALGSTDKLGIKGGYKGITGGNDSAVAWIADNLDMQISNRSVEKNWAKVKKTFAVKFRAGMDNPSYEDLWDGLSDQAQISSTFSQSRGGDRAYDDSRMASIVKRHAYRQVLRSRKQA